MKSKLIGYIPFLFIIFIWFLFSFPYFFNNLVPYPSDYQVNAFFPWKEYRQFWGPIKNSAMPDVIDQIYPWKHFTIQLWKQNQIPFWNPNSFSGTPHLANYQSSALTPFNLLFIIFPFLDAWSIVVLLQPLLAGVFTYFLARSLGVSKNGSCVSGITFMFCGFMVVWMAYGTLSLAIAFLPLVLYFIEKNFQKINLFSLLLLSVSLPFSFFSGHFQTSFYLFITSFLFLIYRLLIVKNKKRFFLVVVFYFLGFMFSLPQLIPSIQLYLYSARSEIFITKGGIPFYYLITVLSPDFFGNPVTQNNWFGYYGEWASFIGIISLFLALFVFLKINKQTAFFIGLGIGALVFAIDSPIQQLLGFLKIPVLSTSNPNRIIVLFSFSFAILAGFGLDQLVKYIKNKEIKMIVIPFLFIFFLLSFAWVFIIGMKYISVDNAMVAKKNMLLPTALFFGITFLILVTYIKKKLLWILPLTIILVVSFDMLRFSTKWMPFEKKSQVFPDLPIIKAMQNNIGFGRLYPTLGAFIDTYYNLPSVGGYDPLYIGRYGEFINASSNGKFVPAERSVVALHANGLYTKRVMDLLGVHLIFHPKLDTKKSWALPVWDNKNGYNLIFEDKHYQLYRNPGAMDRVQLFNQYEIIKGKKDILHRFYTDTFDFRKVLILEEEPGIKIGNMVKGKAKIVSYTPNKIHIAVDTDAPALLFLSDNYYPGWKAYVNKKEAKIYRSNYSFRSIVVPKGKSDVVFEYSFQV